jgi:phosphopantothenoylcysteine synthetase/decarboxylase
VTRALVTAGGTREPIDGVRFITNFSSGTTGAALADAFAAAGWEVTLVRAHDAVRPASSAVAQVPYSSVADLDDACRRELGARAYDAVVHAAAVSDFVVGAVVVDGVRHAAPLAGKLDSAHGLSVELVPSPKILPRLRGYGRNDAVVVVGFKLTNGATTDEATTAVRRQFETAGVDAVVHNDLTEMDHAHDRHVATLWIAGAPTARASSNAELAALLVGLVSERVSASGA